jgi:predicted transcriptional regulator YdeE
MEEYIIPKNINTVYIQATSFPNGVKSAHERLHTKVPDGEGRRFFGISYPNEKGEIIYKAAAEELHPGEAGTFGLETFTIRKGKYISEDLKDWCRQEGKIKEIFEKLLKHPDIVKDGYCLEEYFNDGDIRLMVTVE